MADINLLPIDLAPSGPMNKTARRLKTLSYLALSLFLISAVVVIGYFYYLTTEIKESEGRQEVIINTIKSLENTEQKYFLLKERIGKIKNVLAMESSDNNIANAEYLLTNLSDVVVNEIQVGYKKINGSFVFKSSSQLSDFLEILLQNDEFQEVKIKSIQYNPKTGYSLDLELGSKWNILLTLITAFKKTPI